MAVNFCFGLSMTGNVFCGGPATNVAAGATQFVPIDSRPSVTRLLNTPVFMIISLWSLRFWMVTRTNLVWLVFVAVSAMVFGALIATTARSCTWTVAQAGAEVLVAAESPR